MMVFFNKLPIIVMSAHRFWMIFLGCLGLAAFWHMGVVIYEIHQYFTLSTPTGPTKIEWTVKELKDDEYIPKSDYTYTIQGESYHGTFEMTSYPCKNAWALEKDIPSLNQKGWIVWYDANSPGHSTLERQFPFKESAYAAILVGIFFYFLSLFRYATRRSQ